MNPMIGFLIVLGGGLLTIIASVVSVLTRRTAPEPEAEAFGHKRYPKIASQLSSAELEDVKRILGRAAARRAMRGRARDVAVAEEHHLVH